MGVFLVTAQDKRRYDLTKEMIDHHKSSGKLFSDLNRTLGRIDEQLKRINNWAFAGNGDHGMEARMKKVELARATERGEQKGIKIFWVILAAILTLVLGVVGAVIGVIGVNAFWSD